MNLDEMQQGATINADVLPQIFNLEWKQRWKLHVEHRRKIIQAPWFTLSSPYQWPFWKTASTKSALSQMWQVTRRDNGNYMITKEEEFGVAWSLANLTRSYSSQYSASVVGKICLENPDETFALKLKDEAVKEDAVYSMRVSSNSPTISDSSFVIVSGQMVQVITQDPPSIKDIPYIWKFEFVRPI
ncbi:hypothetical protein AGABI1DRAFT_106685 [Agaricus bisporus var. burnettii JB137-S8]|uniref:Uncharacterized protein n=1 Tax=Agaricus bisporus var. burnettii (strain JB137-S8 / ATCC MYA-4627 / FGSC 10392) TaxID=597362 RepID=K5XVD1_AGABU|nr:uncharacterized protein AGABI1DRAFT_106685 [Agaricus bisporus var. burnettii JB137-S8]EKM79085.1 hypothetical protein AGABI1DRAFT_106685 [Agaricus bisporus var. burnettii JB137-S8]